VKGESAGNARDGIDVDVADVSVALYQLLDLRPVDLNRRVGERTSAADEAWSAIVVELDRKILKAHA
jgi:hypothetical protein